MGADTVSSLPIPVSIAETIRLMKENEAVIEQHGG